MTYIGIFFYIISIVLYFIVAPSDDGVMNIPTMVLSLGSLIIGSTCILYSKLNEINTNKDKDSAKDPTQIAIESVSSSDNENEDNEINLEEEMNKGKWLFLISIGLILIGICTKCS